MTRFEVKNSCMLARQGKFSFDGAKVETPTMWMGFQVKDPIIPWIDYDIDGVMVNIHDVIHYKTFSSNVQKEGFSNMVGTGAVFADSGGYRFLNRDEPIPKCAQILDMYRKCGVKMGAALDLPLIPNEKAVNAYRRRKTLQNAREMLSKSKNEGLIIAPVVHGHTTIGVRRMCESVQRIYEEVMELEKVPVICLGSIVPILLGRYGNKQTLVIDLVVELRKFFPEAYMHCFGAGGIATSTLMYMLGVDSVDSLGWKRRAGLDLILLPRIGERFLAPREKWSSIVLRPKEYAYLDTCDCPVCRDRKSSELIKEFKTSFQSRAIHNAYVQSRQSIGAREALKENRFREFCRDNVSNQHWIRMMDYALKKMDGIRS